MSSRRARKQRAVLWEWDSFGPDGNPKVKSPKELKVRYETGKSEVIGSEDSPVASDVTMWVGQAVPVSSIMRLGTRRSLPAAPDDLLEVIDEEDTPSVTNKKTERVILLRRYHNTLPTIVS